MMTPPRRSRITAEDVRRGVGTAARFRLTRWGRKRRRLDSRATGESAALAKQFSSATCTKQGIRPGQLTLHADCGSRMKSNPVALLLSDLGVTKTHSRPYTSDDNPCSEPHFKTLKYRPDFPDRFGAIQDARLHCQVFFPWYHDDHCHSGIAFMTPADVHYGRVPTVIVYSNRDDARILEAKFLAP